MAATKNYPKLLKAYRPSGEEVENYSRLIMQHEHYPASEFAACQREAELQLWAMKSLKSPRPARRQPQEISA